MAKSARFERKETYDVHAKYEAFYTGRRVQFSHDGQLMVCSCGNQLKLVNVNSGNVQDTIKEKEDDQELTCFILGEDDTTLVTARKNGILKQWNLKEKSLVRTWKSFHNDSVSRMALDSSHTLLATGGTDSVIKVWDIVKKYCTHNLKGAQGVCSVVHFYMINSTLHVFGSADDYNIHIWNLDSSKHVSTLQGHCSTVTDLVFCQEQNKMLSCSRDKVVLLWNLDDFKLLKTIPVFESIESIILVPETTALPVSDLDNKNDIHFITAGDKGVLQIWSVSSAKCVFTQENSLITPPLDAEYKGQVITQACFVPALNVISVITYEHNIILYNVQDFSLSKQFVGYNDDVLDIKFMGENDQYIAVATNSPYIKVFELETFACQLLKDPSDIVTSLDVFAQKPNILVSGSKDNIIRVWEMNPESRGFDCIYIGYGHTHSISSVACCKKKPTFFLSGSEDTTLKLWDMPSKVPLVTLKFSLSARCTVKAHDKYINSIAVSINDKVVATGSQDGTAKLWDSNDLSLMGTMRGHRRGVWCVAFSPVDLVLATSSGDKTIKIWSLSDFTTLKTFEGHEASVLNVLFLTRGTQLVSSASDGIMKLWDIKTTECIKTFDAHEDRIWALTTSAKEDFLVTGAADSNIIVWKDVTVEEKEKEISKQEEFILQEQELSNLIHHKKWLKALCLSITLEQPYRTLNIINEILLESNGRTALKDTVTKLRKDQIEVLLKFVVEWNTNSKNYFPAHLVLNSIFETYTHEELLQMPNCRSTVESLLPYAERHQNRLKYLLQDTHLIEFLWHNIKIAGHMDNTS